uniref:Amine oxidase domain-containing protein n=1 Tax=Electrophorus electricus TaxID=8005 RepID=A0A4W4FR84_ELEEL
LNKCMITSSSSCLVSSVGSRDAKIVVVGAGFAGLAAASLLFQAGFQNVKILEGSRRIGGRIHTTRPFSKNVIELGANWIHGQEGNPIYQLAKDHDLLVEGISANKVMCQPSSVTPRDYFFKEGGKLLCAGNIDQVCSLFSKLTSKAFESELEDRYRILSLGGYLDAAFAESPLAASEDGWRIFEWCKRSECTDEASSSLYEVSASEIGYYIALEGGFFNSLGPGGYQAILDVFLESLPLQTILMSKPVKSIQWDLNKKSLGTESRERSHPIKIICENEESFEADHVIVTVSLGVLKQHAGAMFEPALPKSKMDAIERLGFGTVDKIFLCFSERFWPEDCAGIQLVWDEGPEDKAVYGSQTEGDGWKKTWFKKICGFDTVARHPTVLCGWITGREALHMETLQDGEVADICVKLLRSFTGWSVPDVSQVLISKWGSDPWVFGSYTFVPHMVNGVKEHEAMAAPLPLQNCLSLKPLQVLFAGEATHVNFYTTTHGAYLSGIREAQRLINHYSDKALCP